MSDKPGDNLQAPPAVITAAIQIKRASTGKVDEFTLTLTPVKPEDPQTDKGVENGRNA